MVSPSADRPATYEISETIRLILLEWEGSDEFASECADRIVEAVLGSERLQDALSERMHLAR
jgi:hypothetical protein